MEFSYYTLPVTDAIGLATQVGGLACGLTGEAESMWDFSSRHHRQQGTGSYGMTTTRVPLFSPSSSRQQHREHAQPSRASWQQSERMPYLDPDSRGSADDDEVVRSVVTPASLWEVSLLLGPELESTLPFKYFSGCTMWPADRLSAWTLTAAMQTTSLQNRAT